MRTLYHTSPNIIDQITKDGLFGDVLFFSPDVYYMTQSEHAVVYEIALSDDQIISARDLYDEQIIEDIALALDTDSDTAYGYLTDRDQADGEDGWYIQQCQAETARKLGYVAVESEDEQGAVYAISMTDRLDMLRLSDER